MSGLWIRVDADEVNGERVAVLVAELGIDPITALGHLVAFSGKVAHHRPEGDIGDVPPVLLEQWAYWTGARGAFARVVLEKLCHPPGELHDWEETMGDLIRRRRIDRDRKAEERRQEKARRDNLPPAAAQAAATGAGVSTDSPRKSAPTERDGTDGTNEESLSTGTVGGAPSAEARAVVDKSVEKSKGEDGGLWGNLPPSAVRLLTLFYAKATRKRKRDVLDQLRDTIDPARPGAQLDRNTVVKARDVAQLEAACQRVLRTPPRDLDLGVRFVLHEITTLEARRTTDATEGSREKELREEQRLGDWRRARAIAVSQWERENPARSAELLAQVDRELPEAAITKSGELGRRVRLEHYAQLAADIARFPAADDWTPAPAPASRRSGMTPIGAVSPK